jgi:hypothetical protein
LLKRAGKRRHTIARLCRRPAAAATRVTANHPPSHRATDQPAQTGDKRTAGADGTIIIPALVLSLTVHNPARVPSKKIGAAFRRKVTEFPKMAETPPRCGRQGHNECL